MTPEEILAKVTLGMSRSDIIKILGEPDCVGGTSRKYRTPSTYKYGDIELWFDQHRDGVLHTIWDERNEVILKR